MRAPRIGVFLRSGLFVPLLQQKFVPDSRNKTEIDHVIFEGRKVSDKVFAKTLSLTFPELVTFERQALQRSGLVASDDGQHGQDDRQ
jgi:hypothetical protein